MSFKVGLTEISIVKASVDWLLGKLLLLLLLLLLSLSSSLLFLPTAVELSIGGSSPYTGTGETNKNKYTQTKQLKKSVQTMQRNFSVSPCNFQFNNR